jgi:galactose mutarotase-like enzyme
VKKCFFQEAYINKNKILILENELLRIKILTDKGADVFSIFLKTKNIEILGQTTDSQNILESMDFKSVKAKFYNDYYIGGWQSILPTNGKRQDEDFEGGESSTLPWEYEVVEESDEKLEVKLSTLLKNSGLLLKKSFTLLSSSTKLYIQERVINQKQNELLFNWTQHPAFSQELLGQNTVFEIPECEVFDYLGYMDNGSPSLEKHIYSAKSIQRDNKIIDITKYEELSGINNAFYTFKNVKDGFISIKNKDSGLGVKLSWDIKTFPHMWFWVSNGMELRTVAFEPSTTFVPDFNNSDKQKTLLQLEAEGEWNTWICLEVSLNF